MSVLVSHLEYVNVCLLYTSNALTGQSSNLFAHQKERGADLVLSRITVGLAIAFFVLAILLRMG